MFSVHRPETLGERLRVPLLMATGGGETSHAISGSVRRTSAGGAWRVLLRVDRGTPGRQALREFQSDSTSDDGRQFSELSNVVYWSGNRIDPLNKVVITTSQRLSSILKGEAAIDAALEPKSAIGCPGASPAHGLQPVEDNARIPPDFFDVNVEAGGQR
ncbi:MAG: hypothetical protein VKO39_08070 [Cyanobacteriota bacterium]|nr:hypothetical protein [Cyanobacteriota bacterium]